MFSFISPSGELQRTAAFLARIVIPRSRSCSPESITRSTGSSCAPNVPAWRNMASTSVVLPWSTWETIAMLRSSGQGDDVSFRSMSPRERLSAAEARRTALAAQGFGRPRPDGKPDGWALRRVLGHVGQLQIDSVNVLERAHYLPLFSRLGPYPRALLDDASRRAPRKLFEYWGHEASLLPVATQPLLRWRMERAADDAWGSMVRVPARAAGARRGGLRQIADHGPLTAAELAEETPAANRALVGLERLARRRSSGCSGAGASPPPAGGTSSACTTLPERVLPAAVLDAPTPEVADAQRELVRIAARGLGVAAEPDLRDYFRLPTAEAKLRVAELVESGELLPVEVEGWGRTQGYLWREARIPRSVDARRADRAVRFAALGPPRVERIFGFSYRLEIYVPKPKRVHGYYVLPFLLGDRLVARVDLKADRKAGRLLVKATHLEAEAPPETREALAAELALLASWLELQSP